MVRAGSHIAAMAEAQTRRQRDEQRRVAATRAEAATRQRVEQVAEEALVRAATAQAAALAVSREAAHAHHPHSLSSSTKQVSFGTVNGVAAPHPLALYGALSDEEAPLMSSLDARLNQYAPRSGMALSNGAADVATIPVKLRQPARAHAPLRSALRSGLSRAGHTVAKLVDPEQVEHAPAPPPLPPPPLLPPPPPAPAPPASVARAEGSVQVVNPELFASLLDL
jgi:hypothetical protein